MKTSLMPPALVVVSARIGRVGQSSAEAPKAGSMSATTAAKAKRIEQRTDNFSLKTCTMSRDAIAVGGEAEQPLHPVIARRARRGDAPLLGAAGLEFPEIRVPRLTAVVDLQHFGGIFQWHFVGPAEIGKHIIARPVAARAPFD